MSEARSSLHDYGRWARNCRGRAGMPSASSPCQALFTTRSLKRGIMEHPLYDDNGREERRYRCGPHDSPLHWRSLPS